MESLANTSAIQGDFPAAARYYAAGRRYHRRSGMSWNLPSLTEPMLSATQSALSPSEFELATAEGANLTLAEIARTWNTSHDVRDQDHPRTDESNRSQVRPAAPKPKPSGDGEVWHPS